MATAPAAGRKLTAREIAKYAYDAGFRGEALITAVAIAMAESGGFTGAHNPEGEDSRGLWQINVAPNVRPNKWGDLSDPVINARAAFEVSGGGTNFKPWTTFTGATAAGRHSSFRNHYDEAMIAAQSIGVNPGEPIPPGEGAGVTAASSGAVVDELPPDATPEQIENYIKKNYPQAAPFLANPEIRGILVRPDIDEMDEIEIEALLRNTTYWQTHGPDSRAFDRLIGTDVAAAVQAIDTAKNVLGDLFARNGVQASDQQLGEAAKKGIRAGWFNLEGQVVNDAALKDFMVFALGNQTGEGQIAAGEVAYSADKLGEIAREYLVPLTRRQLDQWALELTSGKQSEESFRSWMTGLAKARFGSDPDLSGAIERGMSPGQFFQGHIATVAQILEMDDAQIDLMDPRWMPLIETVDASGKRRAPTLGEVAQWARDQEAFKDTRTYKQTEAELSLQLARSMGALA